MSVKFAKPPFLIIYPRNVSLLFRFRLPLYKCCISFVFAYHYINFVLCSLIRCRFLFFIANNKRLHFVICPQSCFAIRSHPQFFSSILIASHVRVKFSKLSLMGSRNVNCSFSILSANVLFLFLLPQTSSLLRYSVYSILSILLQVQISVSSSVFIFEKFVQNPLPYRRTGITQELSIIFF